MEDAESLAQTAVERLSEDESLRGDLTDDGFGPLLEWAANAAIAYAQNLKSDKPDEAMDVYASRLKKVMQEVVSSAQAGKIEDPAALLDFEMPAPQATRARIEALKLESGQADDNAIKISGALAEALTAAPEAAPATSGEKAPEKAGESLPSLEKTEAPATSEVAPKESAPPAAEPKSQEESAPPEAKESVSSHSHPHHKAGEKAPERAGESLPGLEKTEKPGESSLHVEKPEKPGEDHKAQTGPESRAEQPSPPVAAENQPEPPKAVPPQSEDDNPLSKVRDVAADGLEKGKQLFQSLFSRKKE